jgi:hypothetical protein
MMALVMLVVAFALIFGAFQQQTENEQQAADVVSRGKALDQREQQLDQRRSALDQRDDDVASQQAALIDQEATQKNQQAALDEQKEQQDAFDADLSSREQALEEKTEALKADQAALKKAQEDLSSKQQALSDKQAETDSKLSDYQALKKAVDDALGARERIASAMTVNLKALTAWKVDGDGAVSIGAGTLFDENSAVLSEDGKQALDQMLPTWQNALAGESIQAVAVEVTSAASDSVSMDLAARRALAILQYAQNSTAAGEEAREAMLQKGASAARADVSGESSAVFRFYLNYDALKTAR